ncbi:hypothetical protein I4U23_018220 [Adineta vaga]|nr:hypothetical protein I4U23_018220 [Adineta vaga]
MERIRWSEKQTTLQSVVEDSAIRKPTLVQIGTRSIIVGEKIHGQFIMASPCKVANDRFDVLEHEIILSSKHTGIWRVISKGSEHIHRLATTDIEMIYKKDIQNQRIIPRSYICAKQIEAFELHVRKNDPTVFQGYRIDRKRIFIEENVEFQITDIGEVEYTPSEGERTSQDYINESKSNVDSFLQFLLPDMQKKEKLIRNRVLRSLHCTTMNEQHKRSFFLEVNEQSCDIYPIASEGSTELRYLHSTQNLFDYITKFGNDKLLYVKLIRGDRPIKSIEFDGYMILKSILSGDKIPLCRVEDLEVTLVNPDLTIPIKVPINDQSWRSFSNIRTAEFQCMQLTISLLARHESEIYVSVDVGKNSAHFLKSNSNQQERITNTIKKYVVEQIQQRSKYHSQDDLRLEQRRQPSRDHRSQTPILSRAHHPISDELYRNDEKRTLKSNQEQIKNELKLIHHTQQRIPDRSNSFTIHSSETKKTKTKRI